MIFTQHYLACLSHASYLIGDETTGRGVVVDPRRDVDVYLGEAAQQALHIERVIETHIHADFLSGHLELANLTGAVISYGEGAEVEFPIEPLRDGQRLSLGEVTLQILATPGHTPESICIAIYEHRCDEVPYGVLTGDTLFVGDVGRPDLLSASGLSAEALARKLYGSLHGKLLVLPDATRVFPAHGAGSACGKQLSSETSSTIGEQRQTNYALQKMDEDQFVAVVTEGQPFRPHYFEFDSQRNRQLRPLLDDHAPPLIGIDDVCKHADAGAILLDSREPANYASGHLRGAVNLAGGMCAWAAAGLPVVSGGRDPGLVVHRENPLNCETSIAALIGGVVMPNARFYVRNHFLTPVIDPDRYELGVRGLVERPLRLRLRDLQNMPSQSLVVTLECAGNGRSAFDPPVAGEPWRFGAASTAEWTGVPLVEVLDRAGLTAAAHDIVFQGADAGLVDGSTAPVRFERSLSVDDARKSGALVAYAMNGEPLPVQHGRPVRLIVPGWYAVASVKWLTDIEAIGEQFEGFYQTHRYIYERERDGRMVAEPVRLQQVRALITEPTDGASLSAGELVVRGLAWSGAAPIERVDVSVDGGAWQPARLIGERRRYSWQCWELLTSCETHGTRRVRARATDLAGRVQPERPEWNRLGYGGNAIQEIAITVE